MKLFIDTANIADIESALKTGAICGITTNPSLMAKEPKGNYVEHLKRIVDLANKYGDDISVSAEVFSEEHGEMIRQAHEFNDAIGYKHLAVKIPISHGAENFLPVIRELVNDGIVVNCTAGMTPMQMTAAAAAGAKYVSIFYNRIKDAAKEEQHQATRELYMSPKEGIVEQSDFNPDNVVRETRALIAAYPNAEIIAGSIRTPVDVKHAGLAGAHIVTLGYPVFQRALKHFKTDHAVEQFTADFAAWMK